MWQILAGSTVLEGTFWRWLKRDLPKILLSSEATKYKSSFLAIYTNNLEQSSVKTI